MKIIFKDGCVVIDGIETTIPEEYWKERWKGAQIYKKAFEIARKMIAESQ